MSENFPEKLKTRPLKIADKVLSLRCKKEQDIKVISSLLQDSLVSNADIYFERTEKTFAFIVNRFCWEKVSGKNSELSYFRVLSGVNVQNVISVKQKNLIQKKIMRLHYFTIYLQFSMTGYLRKLLWFFRKEQVSN